MGRKKSIVPGFSLNRALGITSAKQKIARATGIPTTKQGRKRKMQSHLWTAAAVGVAAACSGKPQRAQTSSRAVDEPDYGLETRRFNAVGVTFRNEDGEARQEIIARLQRGGEYSVRLERYEYEGEPAYHIIIDSKVIGNVPKDLAAEFAQKEDNDYWLLISAAGIHGGSAADGDDYEDRSYGVHMTVKIVSPAEREARHMWVDGDGNLHQDSAPTVARPSSSQRTAPCAANDVERAVVDKHRRIRRDVLLVALALCAAVYVFCVLRNLLF